MKIPALVLPLFVSVLCPAEEAAPGEGSEEVPPLRVVQPVEHAVFQRDAGGQADVPLVVELGEGVGDGVEFRAIERMTQRVVKEWSEVTEGMAAKLAGGWYQLEFRAMQAGRVVATATVDKVGVGEVFVTCGQSNSANHGRPAQRAEDDRVSSAHFQTGVWQRGDDPQPGATGGGGSPWPVLGSVVADWYDVPVGFVCVGVGGSPVSSWTPGNGGYARLRAALELVGPHGCRAVLWHQGETDSIRGTSADDYAKMLGQVIEQSREDAGWDVPWGVALASFHPAPEATAERQAAVVAGQRKVIETVPGVFEGPETDSFHTKGWLSDAVHFNAEGLTAHGRGWAEALEALLGSPPEQAAGERGDPEGEPAGQP